MFANLQVLKILVDVIKRLGPIKSHTPRFFVTKSYEDLTVVEFRKSGKIAKVVSLVPEPEAFFCMPEEVEKLKRPSREDSKLRIQLNLIHMSQIYLGG